MAEPKPFASLSSGLLARKGAAKPAMRPQGFGQMGMGLEDLGWNDMGHSPQSGTPQYAPREQAPLPEHVPSSIAALTPAPRLNGHVQPVEEPSSAPEPAAPPPVVEQQRAVEAAFAEKPEPVETDFVEEPEQVEAEVPEQPEPIVAEIAEQPEPVKAEVAPKPEPVKTARPAKVRAPSSGQRSLPGEKAKAAFTLRLDPHRHLKLRLACAVKHRSAQQIVTEALDHFLATLPEIEAIASHMPAKAGATKI